MLNGSFQSKESLLLNFFDPIENNYPTRRQRKKKKNRQVVQHEVSNINYRLTEINPKTETQRKFFQEYQKKNVAALGFAGTGKTFLSIYMAMKDILHHHKYDRLVIVRSAVPSRDIGFLPGKAEDKLKPFEAPYYSIFDELFGGRKNVYEHFKNNGMVAFEPTSFMRGQTFDNCILVIDEAQNMNYMELSTVLTRVGKNVKIVLCGDIKQDDLASTREASGLAKVIKILKRMNSVSVIEFQKQDIVRSEFVKEFLIAESEVE